MASTDMASFLSVHLSMRNPTVVNKTRADLSLQSTTKTTLTRWITGQCRRGVVLRATYHHKPNNIPFEIMNNGVNFVLICDWTGGRVR
jgi:hypothetical protein